MRFTRRTYRGAYRRAFRNELQAFHDHEGARRGPEAWFVAAMFVNRLNERSVREQGRPLSALLLLP